MSPFIYVAHSSWVYSSGGTSRVVTVVLNPFWGTEASGHVHLLHSLLLDLTYMTGYRLDWKPVWSPSLLPPFPQQLWNLFNYSLKIFVTTINLQNYYCPWKPYYYCFIKGTWQEVHIFPWSPSCSFWSRYFKVKFNIKIVQYGILFSNFMTLHSVGPHDFSEGLDKDYWWNDGSIPWTVTRDLLQNWHPTILNSLGSWVSFDCSKASLGSQHCFISISLVGSSMQDNYCVKFWPKKNVFIWFNFIQLMLDVPWKIRVHWLQDIRRWEPVVVLG